MTPKITIEKSKGQHIETPITSERSKILTFRKKRWNHNDGIFQIWSTCFVDPGPPCRLNIGGFMVVLKVNNWSKITNMFAHVLASLGGLRRLQEPRIGSYAKKSQFCLKVFKNQSGAFLFAPRIWAKFAYLWPIFGPISS